MLLNTLSINKGYAYKFCLLLLTFLLVVGSLYSNELSKVLLLFAVATNVIIIISLRKVQPAMIMGLFTLSYVLYLIPYYFFGFVISGHQQYYQPALYNKVLGIHALFLSSFLLFIKPSLNKGNLLIRDLIKPRENKVIFFSLLVLMIAVLATVKGDSILDGGASYDTYIENLDKQGGGLEYFYILFISAFYFTKSAKLRNSLLLLVVIYCYTCVTRGYRIQLVQIVFLTFILFFDGKIKTRYILILSFFGFLLSEILGVMKTTGSASIEELLKLYDRSSGIIISNQTDVFYSSVVFVGLVKDGIMSLPLRIWSTMGFFWNCIAPSSFVWTEARLPSFALRYTTLGGGGLVSAYFFIWFGYLGTIGIGGLIARYISIIYRHSKNNIYKITGILILSTFPRWFAYDPSNFLFRLPLYLYTFYWLLIMLHNSMLKIRQKANSSKVLQKISSPVNE